MKQIIIFGSGGHGRSVYEVIRTEKKFKVKGFFNSIKKTGDPIFRSSIISEDFKELKADLKRHKIDGGIIAIGDNFLRNRLYNLIINECPGFKFITSIHPTATVSKDVTIGEGTVIMAHAFVNSGSVIGNHVIINSSSSSDHNCVLNDFSSIGPGAILGGKVSIGKMSAVCLGANIINGIIVGDNTVIGAGSLVLKNVQNNILAYGTPANMIKKRKSGDEYL